MITYVIQMALIEKSTLETRNFVNLWGCPTEERARKECIFLQTAANKEYETRDYKYIYKYETIFIYED